MLPISHNHALNLVKRIYKYKQDLLFCTADYITKMNFRQMTDLKILKTVFFRSFDLLLFDLQIESFHSETELTMQFLMVVYWTKVNILLKKRCSSRSCYCIFYLIYSSQKSLWFISLNKSSSICGKPWFKSQVEHQRYCNKLTTFFIYVWKPVPNFQFLTSSWRLTHNTGWNQFISLSDTIQIYDMAYYMVHWLPKHSNPFDLLVCYKSKGKG